jgi:hypothetical protein
MKRQMILATAFSAAFAVSVAAQDPPSTAQTPSQEKAQQVTLTGCLTQASPSATGTAGTAGTSATPQFVLTNATPGSGAPSSATGTSGAASSTAMGKSFKLMGSSSDLKDHINAKVEVKGTIEKSSAYPSGGAAAGTSASDKDMQTLRVTSVRKIADTCSGQ